MAEEFNCLEHCPDLGHCCREFSIYLAGIIVDKKFAREEVEEYLKAKKFPFKVLCLDERSRMWCFTCHNLGSDGLCTDYENRPRICRDSQPRTQQPLCCVPKPTIGEYLSDLAFSFVNKIKTIGKVTLPAQ